MSVNKQESCNLHTFLLLFSIASAIHTDDGVLNGVIRHLAGWMAYYAIVCNLRVFKFTWTLLAYDEQKKL